MPEFEMFKKSATNFMRFARLCKFSSTNANYENFDFNPTFSPQEQEKILNVLNESSTEQLLRFDVSKGRIKRLESWRNKNGSFRSLADILEVDGLGVNILDRLCKSILSEDVVVVKRNKIQMISPTLSTYELNSISSAVGLHLGPTGISWAKLSCDNNLDSWNFYKFDHLPKKILPSDTFFLAMQILQSIPCADMYILENNHSGQKSSKITLPSMPQLELASMLIALINTSKKHNVDVDKPECPNKVYNLKSNLPARLFGTLVGKEKVSAIKIVSNILKSSENLPCKQIHVEHELKDLYNNCTSTQCDILGNALLLVITFMNLCVYKTQSSLNAIRLGKRRIVDN